MEDKEFYGAILHCDICGENIQSKYTHDWVKCKCEKTYIYIDGGAYYLRVGASIDSKYSVVDVGNYYPEKTL